MFDHHCKLLRYQLWTLYLESDMFLYQIGNDGPTLGCMHAVAQTKRRGGSFWWIRCVLFV